MGGWRDAGYTMTVAAWWVRAEACIFTCFDMGITDGQPKPRVGSVKLPICLERPVDDVEAVKVFERQNNLRAVKSSIGE